MIRGVAVLDPAQAQAALGETRWRRAYPRHFRPWVEGGLRSADVALASANAGLDAAWRAPAMDCRAFRCVAPPLSMAPATTTRGCGWPEPT